MCFTTDNYGLNPAHLSEQKLQTPRFKPKLTIMFIQCFYSLLYLFTIYLYAFSDIKHRQFPPQITSFIWLSWPLQVYPMPPFAMFDAHPLQQTGRFIITGVKGQGGGEFDNDAGVPFSRSHLHYMFSCWIKATHARARTLWRRCPRDGNTPSVSVIYVTSPWTLCTGRILLPSRDL